MRVSDDIVARLGDALRVSELETPYGKCLPVLRRCLEIALADVPEPSQLRENQTYLARIAELEAKLASVRKWREEYDAPTERRNGLSAEAAKVLDSILDARER